jgi:SAM-dependent methyltransferase
MPGQSAKSAGGFAVNSVSGPMRPTDPPYSRYSRHYDQIGQSLFGLRSLEVVLGLLTANGAAIASAIDLACGTGSVAMVLAEAGVRAVGLDRSPEMIALARAEAERRGLSITWITGDMTAFTLAEPVDLCTCFYDAVNYLPDEESLRAFIECARQALNPGGFLAFDINTLRKLRDHWSDSVIVAEDNDEALLLYRSWFDESRQSSPLMVTGFERRDDGSWDRFDEEHIEYVFAVDSITQMLNRSGFEPVQILDWGERPSDEVRDGSESSFRVLYLARKPVDQGRAQ